MKRLLRILLVIAFFTCVSVSAKTGVCVLKYEDFGPPVIANNLIGMDWWQWQPHGDSRPTRYDIKVVVYRGLQLDKVKAKYPVAPEKNKDYRYVEYADALTYLDQHIAENMMQPVTSQLIAARRKIIRSLGKK